MGEIKNPASDRDISESSFRREIRCEDQLREIALQICSGILGRIQEKG